MSKSDLNIIFGQILVRMWRTWSTRLINTQKKSRNFLGVLSFYAFLKKHIFRKLTTDFENHHK